jgi:hypothetical protein
VVPIKKFVLCCLVAAVGLGASADDKSGGKSDKPATSHKVPAVPQPKQVLPGTDTEVNDKGLPKDVATYIQDVSVTIHAGRSQGSGTIFTRDKVNYVWTAAHVVAGLRNTREIVDPNTGSPRTVVEFDDAKVVREIVEDGRKVGQVEMDAEVIRYSNADTGQDLALLRIRKRDYFKVSTVFFLEKAKLSDGKVAIKEIPKMTDLLHCGSLLGQVGSNSVTTGVMSQSGRVVKGVVYDQTTCTAFPGSSGGGVFLKDGRYVGMLVRGAGETFNLIVPQRRLYTWAKKVGVLFAVDPEVAAPTDEELRRTPVEDEAKGGSHRDAAARSPGYGPSPQTSSFPFLILERHDQPTVVPQPMPAKK